MTLTGEASTSDSGVFESRRRSGGAVRQSFLLSGVVVAITLLAAAIPAGAENRRVRLTMEAFGISSQGPQHPRCALSEELTPGVKRTSWITIGEARPDQHTGIHVTEVVVRCGEGAVPKRATSSVPMDSPYLKAAVTLYTFPYGERLLGVDIVASGGTLTTFSTAGAPEYKEFTFRRQVFVEDGFRAGGEVFVPALPLSAENREKLGLQDALLKLVVIPAADGGAAYGTLSVTSDMVGAHLFLDGGRVGEVPASGTVRLTNVRAGARELGVKDASGREVRRRVEVVKRRTLPVTLQLAAPAFAASYRLIPLGKNPEGYEHFRRERDGAVVVTIPAGEFLMGNKNSERTPMEHLVELSEFLFDMSPVTWAQYIEFAAATETPLPPDDPYWGIQFDHPVSYVTWEEASAYCDWVGGRLPTEAEREKAARGTDGRKYPWGNEDPDPERAVFRHPWGGVATEPVGTHRKGDSPYGLMDMGGNVWEWVSDWYDEKYYEVSPKKDPKGPPAGRAKVVRGGSWDSRPAVTSASVRNWGYRGYREGDFGFRCAMSPRPSPSHKR